jgi:hypothetical protein
VNEVSDPSDHIEQVVKDAEETLEGKELTSAEIVQAALNR